MRRMNGYQTIGSGPAVACVLRAAGLAACRHGIIPAVVDYHQEEAVMTDTIMPPVPPGEILLKEFRLR